ncbi:hypothetical protein L207DRAFT_570068 [Hyaloscypha variabilis F]|uniref:BHLH domain-containing protein n=1 Tax=Hyaloscypha variabilis (strain UAMH 11265 / GT02V1 / F) TaxID=1149755 RepID=A0A2J6RAK5_HYAVF|nr:hypothetical protein L207DRAFT_570068 [Hyaloscypha variabilis F]
MKEFTALGQEDEMPPYVDGTSASMELGDHDPAHPVLQSDQSYLYISSIPPYFPFNTLPYEHRGQSQLLEWSTVHRTTARSNPQARIQPFSIYGTSSDYHTAEDLAYDLILPSPISSLGIPDIAPPLNSTQMVWERLPASVEDTKPNDAYTLHKFSQANDHDHAEEIEILKENDGVAELELDSVLPMNSRSSSLSTTADPTEGSTTSGYITLEEPEIPSAKRRRGSAPSLRWSTSGKPRKKKFAHPTIVFPQSPTSLIPKTNHNAIEKQYRNRLNDKFEALLSVLPAQEIEGGGGRLAKVSKGDVLILAKDYIESLEKSRDEMQEDRRLLEDDVKGMKEMWMGSGGVGLP